MDDLSEEDDSIQVTQSEIEREREDIQRIMKESVESAKMKLHQMIQAQDIRQNSVQEEIKDKLQVEPEKVMITEANAENDIVVTN